MAVAVSLVAPSAGKAVPDAWVARGVSAARPLTTASSPGDLAGLEAQAAELSRQYRGQLVNLTDAESAASAATARALQLRRQLGRARREIASLAAASYIAGAPGTAIAVLGGGDPQRMLQEAATIDYLARQRSAREQALKQFMAAEQRGEQAARAKTGELRRMVTALASQQHSVEALIARFRPQSTVTGDNITPRMRQVKDEIDRRFGPFTSIGCYRPEASGEHPLGRACDFMLSTGGVMPSGPDIARGYDITAWAQANASRLGIMYIIYRQKIWDTRMASSGWVPMEDRGGITANHYDHVHISVF
jgi:hypothetical protein